MKYHSRTVSWRFRESSDELPDLKEKRSIAISAPSDLFHSYHPLFDQQVRERFVVFWLNSCNKIVGFEIVSEGTLNSSLVHPREVFRGAIVATSASIIVAHNHPSGNPEPSQEDIAITKQLIEAGKILGIPIYDHIIFTDSSFTSFAEKGLM